jgi:NADH-quinone oxidoreductase subunit F
VIEDVKASGLVGRGGAAFPTGLKWQGAAEVQSETKYVVCNADESEPGTFTDRALMEIDPHRVLEGLIISAYAVGAAQGYIYVRGEYLQSYASLQNAIDEAHRAGFLGDNILGSNFNFEIEMRLGAGAYICGEETSQFESIEGKRGFPRLKPPYPTTHGLFGKPTVINNVETLANIPYIIQYGADEYRQLGTQDSPGTKLFCLTGDVALPGLYELPFGVTLRELIFDHAGGMRAEYELRTVLVGGAAGAFATPEQLDLPLTFEDLRAAGLSLGSGALIVLDQSRDLRQLLHNLTGFFAHESCGKCYPCQLGTRLQEEIMTRIAKGKSLPGDDQRLVEIAQTMTDASICGLGQTAGMAVMSALKIWPELFKTS